MSKECECSTWERDGISSMGRFKIPFYTKHHPNCSKIGDSLKEFGIVSLGSYES